MGVLREKITLSVKEYFKINWKITYYFIKTRGILNTCLAVIIAIIIEIENNIFINPFKLFLICFLFGNLFTILIWTPYFISSYLKIKSIIKLFEFIPHRLKEKFGLIIIDSTRNEEHVLLKSEIISTKLNPIFKINRHKKFVEITIFNNLEKVDKFSKKTTQILTKYWKNKITLTGWGLKKQIKWKDWHPVTEEKLNKILEELKTISKNENLIVIKRQIHRSE